MDCGETLDARCNVRQEWRLCDVVQTFELSNKDSVRKEVFEFHTEPPYANCYTGLKGESICTFSQSSWCTYLDTTCRTVNRTMRGPTATRNQGKTPEITPTQKNTRMTFWMNISAWNGKRTSTGETEGKEKNLEYKKLQETIEINPDQQHISNTVIYLHLFKLKMYIFIGMFLPSELLAV